jgi:hypothetical protein
MATYKTPAVYIIERNAFLNTIAEAPTAEPALLGFGRYLRTVRGEIGILNLSNSSLAIHSSPDSGFALAILRISARSSCGMGGRPGRDFSRQNNLQPARCQRSKVAGRTTTRALRQSNRLASTTKLTRVPASIRPAEPVTQTDAFRIAPIVGA